MLRFVEQDQPGEQLEIFRELLREYQQFLGLDLCFQNYDAEYENPLAKYTPPRGIVLLGYWNEDICAIGAMQDLGDNICELKRIYVRPEFRRKGIARTISEYLLERAKQIGYERARLDTLARLQGAVPLYKSLGFSETGSYNFNPENDVVYMEKVL